MNKQSSIFIVDDESQILSSLKGMLHIAGYNEVLTCQDSRDVGKYLEDNRFNVALIDLSMPYISGHELLVTFRQQAPDVPVIVVTAIDDIDSAITCLKEGAFDYLVKPVKKDRLLQAISRALELSVLRSENRYLKEFLVSSDERETQNQISRSGGNGSYHAIMGLRNEFRSLVERIPVPVFVAELDSGEVELYNEPYAVFLETSVSPTKAAPKLNLFDRIPVKDSDAIKKDLIEKGCLSYQELTGFRPDGTAFDIVLSCSCDNDGYVIGSFIDRTEQKELERQFHQAQKMEAIGRFASGIAHDFNNVLTVINGSADMILYESGLTADVSEHAQEIKKAVSNAAALTTRLLSFGRTDVVQGKPISAHSVIRDIFGLLVRLVDKDVEISLELNAREDIIEMEPSNLVQILMNLTVNAHDSIDGKGRIQIKTSTIDAPEFEPQDSYRRFRLSVADSGSGISMEARSRIFEPFFSTKQSGTGLGLSTVVDIVKQHNGSIDVQSELGLGTEFEICLPLSTGVVSV